MITAYRSRFVVILIVLTALLTLVIGSGVFLFQRQNQKTQIIVKRNVEMQKECREIDARLKGKDALVLRLVEINQKLGMLDQDLMDYRYVPTYLKQIQKTVLQTGNTLTSIQPGDIRPLDFTKSKLLSQPPPTATTAGPQVITDQSATPVPSASAPPVLPYQIQPIALSVQGSYVSLIRLFDALLHFEKLVYVKSVNLSPETKNGEMRFTVAIQTYAIITPQQYKPSHAVVEPSTPMAGVQP